MGVTGPQQKHEQFFVHWLESVQKQSIRERTYEQYEQMIRLHLIPDLGHHPPEKLSAQHLQSFSPSKREEGLSAKTIIRLQVHENA
jgi:integrase